MLEALLGVKAHTFHVPFDFREHPEISCGHVKRSLMNHHNALLCQNRLNHLATGLQSSVEILGTNNCSLPLYSLIVFKMAFTLSLLLTTRWAIPLSVKSLSLLWFALNQHFHHYGLLEAFHGMAHSPQVLGLPWSSCSNFTYLCAWLQ